jgi:hypothetical protein
MTAYAPGIRAALVSLATLLAACGGESLVTPEPVEQPSGRPPLRMNAEIDGFVYVATTEQGFDVTGIEVNKGGVRISATFANAGGNLTAPLTAADFELRVTGSEAGGPLPSRVEYTPDDAFGGSLYWIAPGQAVPVHMGLYQKSTGGFVLGPYAVTITRRPH